MVEIRLISNSRNRFYVKPTAIRVTSPDYRESMYAPRLCYESNSKQAVLKLIFSRVRSFRIELVYKMDFHTIFIKSNF